MGEPPEFSAEELAKQIRALKVSDLLLSTVSTLGQLAYVKLDAKEIDQARLAIDAIAVLLPTLEGHTDEQHLRDFNQLLANVRLSFASAVSGAQGQGAGPDERAAAPEAGPGTEEDQAAAPETDTAGGQAPGPGPNGDDGGG